MGLLATLPRATRGHLGAANNSLTRATRGYLQVAGGPPRRPGGGLFAPEVPPAEMFRSEDAILTLMLDGNSRVQLSGELETNIQIAGRLWITGASKSSAGQARIRLATSDGAAVARDQSVTTTEQLQLDAEPRSLQADTTAPPLIHRRGTAGLVLAQESRAAWREAPAPDQAESAAGTLWLAGASRFRSFVIDIPTDNSAGQQDEEIVLIAALLRQELDR